MNRYSRVFVTNIEQDTLKNKYYRRVLYTTPLSQLVVMNLRPLEEIGVEEHKDADQFIRIEQGSGLASIYNPEDKEWSFYELEDGDSITISANTIHNIENIHPVRYLKLYTIYTPPQHEPNTLQVRKP